MFKNTIVVLAAFSMLVATGCNRSKKNAVKSVDKPTVTAASPDRPDVSPGLIDGREEAKVVTLKELKVLKSRYDIAVSNLATKSVRSEELAMNLLAKQDRLDEVIANGSPEGLTNELQSQIAKLELKVNLTRHSIKGAQKHLEMSKVEFDVAGGEELLNKFLNVEDNDAQAGTLPGLTSEQMDEIINDTTEKVEEASADDGFVDTVIEKIGNSLDNSDPNSPEEFAP